MFAMTNQSQCVESFVMSITSQCNTVIKFRKINLIVPSKELHLTKNVIAFPASVVQMKIKCGSSAVLQEQQGIITQTEPQLSLKFSPGFVNVGSKNWKICEINKKLSLFLKGELYIFLQNVCPVLFYMLQEDILMKNEWPMSFQVSSCSVHIMPKMAKIHEIKQKCLNFRALEAAINIIQML